MNEFLKLIIPLVGGINWITDGFIFAIVSYAILSGIWFLLKSYRRTRLIDGLSEAVREFNRPANPEILPRLNENFDRNGEFAETWQEFEDSLITRQRNQNQAVVYKTDEASLFFSEERLLEQHLNLRYWNSVPALLVGLGILGTFVGLVWGLLPFSGINFTQTEDIRNAIQALLSGVSTAFITSVWGMFTSLLFNGLEKWRIGSVGRAIVNLQRALDRLFTLTTQEQISFRQEDELAQQTAALMSFSTDLANEITSAMAQGRQEIIQELHDAPEAFSSAMSEQLEPSLNSLNNAIEELRQQREESSTDAIQRLVEEFRDSLSGTTTAQLEGLAETVRNASAGLAALPSQLSDMITSVQDQIDQSRQLLSANSDEQSGRLQGLMDGMLNAFQSAVDTQQTSVLEVTNQSIQTLQSTIAELQGSLTAIATQSATESEAMTIRMRELLESAANRVDDQLAQRAAELQTVSTQSIQALETAIAELQQALTSTASQTVEDSHGMVTRMRELLESLANRTDEQLALRIADIEGVSARSVQTLETAIAELRESLNSTLNAQQQTIQNITSQTEAASVASIDRIRQLAEQSAERLEEIIQAGEQSISVLLNQQDNQIQTVTDQIAISEATLARGREIIEEMNASVTGVRQMIDATQVFSNLLTSGADRLENAGQQLAQAIRVFNQVNENYLTANRETIQQLQGTLVQSGEMLNNFTQRFQTIEAGLRNIFAEIQQGLTEYATTSRNSINEYLSTFSTQLTHAANALAGSVEALNDDIEGLSEMIERIRR